jgi:hypothetical protein
MNSVLRQGGLSFLSLLFLSGCLSANTLQRDEEVISGIDSTRTVWAASSILRSVEGQTGNGFVESKFLDDNTFVQTMRVNLLPLRKGRYEAWLVRENPPDVISLGILESPDDDGTYFLQSREIGDFRSHKNVVITWEPGKDTNPSPGTRVVEGVLQVVRTVE